MNSFSNDRRSAASEADLDSTNMTTPPLLRLVTLGSLGLCLSLSSCIVVPFRADCAYQPACGYRGGGYRHHASPAEGTVTGALLGAAAGGIIGNQSGRGLEGAALGGVLGALAGGALQNNRQPRCAQPAYYQPPAWQSGYGDPYAFEP